MGFGAVDHECRRFPEPFPHQGLERPLVARRDAHRVSRRRRPQRHTGLRPLDGRRGRDLADHAPDRVARRSALVARWEVAVVRDAGAPRDAVDHQHAHGAHRCRPGPPRRAWWTGCTSARTGAGFMEDGYLHLFLVPADGGTPRQLTSGDWNVGARFDGLAGGRGLRLDARRQVDRGRRPQGSRGRPQLSELAISTSWTWRAGRSAS